MKINLSPEVQKNEIDQDVLGVSFASDWLKGSCKFPWPIKKKSRTKLNANLVNFRNSSNITDLLFLLKNISKESIKYQKRHIYLLSAFKNNPHAVDTKILDTLFLIYLQAVY